MVFFSSIAKKRMRSLYAAPSLCLSMFLVCLLFTVSLLAGCRRFGTNTGYERRSLNSDHGCVHNNWEFKYKGKWYPATVPGNIHDDLIANGLIEDPFIGDNERLVQWVADSVWEYRVMFDKNCSGGKSFRNSSLVFEGLDTYAEVFLNGQLLTTTSGDTLTCNMFRKWIFPLPDNLNEKSNELTVRFHPSSLHDSLEASKLPYKLPDNRVLTRKAQYQNGWDWGPKLNTCGIWKNAYIESWNDLKINGFYVSDIETSDKSSRPWICQVEVDVEADKFLSSELLLEITDEDGYSQSIRKKIDLRQGGNVVKIPVTIENPRLWWPNGSGGQHLYYFSLSTVGGDSEPNVPMVKAHGLRTVRLEQNPDSIGESFQFYVNGKPIFMRGMNWIPASSYPGTLARSTGDDVYRELLERCSEANMNMIRVWGGGIYEHDSFYDICDRLGILVWQDFMFACNIYPCVPGFVDNVAVEAEEQVKRLRDHACIAVFCGNNEVHNGLEDWGWQKQFGYSDRQYAAFYADYDKLFNKILPEKCRKHSPSTPYVHSSPTYGWGHDECTTHGCSHYWGVWWGELPFEVWKEKTGRFMTEYGFQSYPEMSTMKSFSNNGSYNLDSPGMRNHQKHSRGVQIISKAIEDLYGGFNAGDIARFSLLSQLTQADGIAQAVETHRIQRQRCSGTLVWQLNDCWPVASWSCIDYFGRPKALYYRLPALFANVTIASQKSADGDIEIFLINDSFSETSGVLKWYIAGNDGGRVVDSTVVQVSVPPYSSRKVSVCPFSEVRQNAGKYHVYVEYNSNNGARKEYLTYFAKPRALIHASQPVTVKADYFDHHAELRISSKSLQKGVFVEETDGADVVFSDNYFDLRPGVEKVVRVDYPNLDRRPSFSVRKY